MVDKPLANKEAEKWLRVQRTYKLISYQGTNIIYKNLKLHLCRQHVPLEALYLVVGGLIVRTKENAVYTAAILDFLSCHRHCKVLKHFRKVFRRVKILSMLEVSFYLIHSS